jgi:hypothetical protein
MVGKRWADCYFTLPGQRKEGEFLYFFGNLGGGAMRAATMRERSGQHARAARQQSAGSS